MMHSEDFNDHTVLQIDLRNLLVTALSTAHVGSTKFQSKTSSALLRENQEVLIGKKS